MSTHCKHCGRLSDEAESMGSTHCNPPFNVQPHNFNGQHPADVIKLREAVRDFVYDCTKDEFNVGWTLSAHQADNLIALVTEAKGKQ
jgi:hypothetical protein